MGRLDRFEVVQARRAREAADAWGRGRIAAEAGDRRSALFWLDRAVRIAPDDPRPALEAALIAASLGDASAEARLEALALRDDAALAWLALARLREMHGDAQRAAAALGAYLSCHAPLDCAAIADLAGRLVTKLGLPGWCALNANGRLAISVGGAEFRIDGRLVARPGRAALMRGGTLAVTLADVDLLGSPLDLDSLRRVEGVVSAAGGDLFGWAFRRAAPEQKPVLILRDASGARRPLRLTESLPPVAAAPLFERFGFRVPAARLRRLEAPFTVENEAGEALFGSPIDPDRLGALEPARRADAQREKRQENQRQIPKRAGLAIVIPVYRDAARTEAMLESLYRAVPPGATIVVIDDAGPEPALRRKLKTEARAGRIVLRRSTRNRGFPASANAGMRLARRLEPGCDILLLNADILLPPEAPARLHGALYARGEIGSATPFSNEATILSYPDRRGGNAAPDYAETIALDRLAARANRKSLVEIPTAIGFCMAIRHDCLDATGWFRAGIFAQGYGEENDWCRRAAQRGFVHVAVPSAFVAHSGGASFGAAGQALLERNLALLDRLHPDYAGLVAAFQHDDPLFAHRRRLDRARFLAGHSGREAVALISHDHGGGIARVVRTRMAQLRAEGVRPILIQPDLSDPDGAETGIGSARLTDGEPKDFPNLRFRLPGEFGDLVALLRRAGVRSVEEHHRLGHHPMIAALTDALGVARDFYVHDYGSFCKRFQLVGIGRRYCGEPDAKGCKHCLDAEGSEATDPITPAALRARSAAEFRAARRIIVPSGDVAGRLRRHFPGIAPTITPWEDDRVVTKLMRPRRGGSRGGWRRVAVVGGIGPPKGFDILRDCVGDAMRRELPLEFVLAGASEDDLRLLEIGRIMITGPYREGTAPDLLREIDADLAFIPSIWPETWGFVVTEAWQAGLYTAVFDLGAPADRVRASGRGFVLPLGLPVGRINDTLLAWQPDLGDLNTSSVSSGRRSFA